MISPPMEGNGSSGTYPLWFEELLLFMLFADEGLGSTEFGGLDFAGDVTLDSCPEFTEDPDRESCAGVGWL